MFRSGRSSWIKMGRYLVQYNPWYVKNGTSFGRGIIQLGPSAFENDEQLIRTLLHELTHEYRAKLGVLAEAEESVVYKLEDIFYKAGLRGGWW